MENLFRPEVQRSAARRLQGEVALSSPLSWQVMGIILSALLIGAVGAVAFAAFPVTASGSFVILAPGPGQAHSPADGLSASILLTPEQVLDVRPGQAVALSFEALPPAKFGAIRARIVSAGCEDAPVAGEPGHVAPRCKAIARLDTPDLPFRGGPVRVAAGYGGTGAITLGERSGLKWLLGGVDSGEGK